MLKAKNVSLVYQSASNWTKAVQDLYCENIDLAALRFPFNDGVLALATYSEMHMVSETFYTLTGEAKAPSLFETTLRSASTIAATAASLTFSSGLIVLMGGPPLCDRAQSATLFLFAVLLATSRPFPKPRRWARSQNVFCIIWTLAMVPLSQYFRCVLTSLLTVGRPASNLDTLEELEDALDAGIVAPCVPILSAPLTTLMDIGPTDWVGEKAPHDIRNTPGQARKGTT
ncbi:hypothetical protein MRX96_006322 [Rhipicephalus microplus]